MIITQIISGEADSAANRYGMLVEAWRASYARALDQSHFGTPKQLQQILVDAYAVAGLFLDAERQLIADVSDKIALEAQQATLDQLGAASASTLADAVSEHVRASDAYLEREVMIQIERDIAFLQMSVRRTYLNVSMSARAQNLATRAALMQYRIGNASELNFFFHDRRNQKWPSRRFVRAVWRQHLLSVYNETVLLTLIEHGLDTALIEHADKKAPPHGMEISVNSDSELPNYAEIKDDLFHPNADAFLTMVLS
jgi:hypothetical protein